MTLIFCPNNPDYFALFCPYDPDYLHVGVPWLSAAPVDIAEYLTALVGRGAGLAPVRQAGPVLSPGSRPVVRRPVVRTATSTV